MEIDMGDPPPTCQHYRIDNETGQCEECGEQMIVQRCNAETVLEAPNAAACNNSACKAALDDGTYDEWDPPAGCTNPHGFYVPDRSRERTVVIGWEYTYECERCRDNSTTVTYNSRGVTWPCGGVHRGARVPVS